MKQLWQPPEHPYSCWTASLRCARRSSHSNGARNFDWNVVYPRYWCLVTRVSFALSRGIFPCSFHLTVEMKFLIHTVCHRSPHELTIRASNVVSGLNQRFIHSSNTSLLFARKQSCRVVTGVDILRGGMPSGAALPPASAECPAPGSE